MADPIDSGFDLNVRLEEDDDGNLPFDLNEPILEDHNNGKQKRQISFSVSRFLFSLLSLSFPFSIGIDLNLPLDEFGAVDFDYVQNLAGKHG